MDTPSCVVVGAGKVGVALAVFLKNAGADVSLLVRTEHAAGLPKRATCRVEWLENGAVGSIWEAPEIPILRHPRELDPNRRWIVVLAVRSYHVRHAITGILAELPRAQIDAVVVPTNGLGAEQMVVNALDAPEKVVSAAITYPCDAGGDRWTTRVTNPHAGLALASIVKPADCPWAEHITDVFRRKHGLNIQFHGGNWDAMKWTKLFLNMVGNALPAILNWPLAKVYAHPALCEIELRLLFECLVALHQRGLQLVGLPGYPLPKIRPLVMLARMQSCSDRLPLVRSLHLPGWLYQRLVTPKILRARGGKEPSLLQERRAGAQQCENLHLDLLHTADRPLGRYRTHQIIGRILRDCFRQGYEYYNEQPERLLAACHRRP